MSAKRDYYEVLGVDRQASAGDIKKQYRKLALKFHPDRNDTSDAAEHFKEITAAYAVLSDDKKRTLYDRHGHAGVDDRYTSEDIFKGARGDFDEMFGGDGFDSIFDQLFGRRRGGGSGSSRGGGVDNRPSRGADRLVETSVTLEEVLHGKNLNAEVQKLITCHVCGGSGCRPGYQPKTCRECKGMGRVRVIRELGGFGSFATEVPCFECRGRGSIIDNPCGECKGKGNKKGKKPIAFKIPPGVDNGDYTIKGEGDEVPNGLNGDLIIRIRVLKHELFTRDGRDLHMELPVDMVDLALGCVLEIPTLDGKESVKIRSGTQPHRVKIHGKGVSHMRKRGKGDMYVHITASIPRKLNRQQKKLLEEFQMASN